MNKQSVNDLQAELGAIRQKLADLEAKQENFKPAINSARRRGFSKGLSPGWIPWVASIVLISGLVFAQSKDALFIDKDGNVGIGTTAPKATLDVAGKLNVSDSTALTNATITGSLTTTGNVGIGTTSPKAPLDVNGNAVINGNATIKGNALMNGNVGIGTTEPGAKLDVNGVVRAKVFASTNPLRNRMYPGDPIVYQEIFEAKNKGVIAKLGSPSYDETTYKARLWMDRHIIKFGGNKEADGNGARVTIPEGFDTVWVRVLGERWNVIHAYFLDGDKEDLGLWTGGWRSSNSYSPDGTLTDGYKVQHQWLPIAAGRAGELVLISKPSTDDNFWISGLAFSKNPWAHAAQSAFGYYWKVNGGDATAWGKDWHNWNGDSLSKINPRTKLKLKIPVVSSGRDKLLYLVEHNNNWNGTMHTGITVNGKPIERFMATYDNPFARHWNSKIYDRYIAARIPARFIPPNARYLTVTIDMTKQDDGIHFREIGTHDLDIPWE